MERLDVFLQLVIVSELSQAGGPVVYRLRGEATRPTWLSTETSIANMKLTTRPPRAGTHSDREQFVS